MKKLITLVTAVVFAGSLVSLAQAQAAGPAGGGIQSGTKADQGRKERARGFVGMKLLRQLNLTPDQQKQVKELVAKYQEKRKDQVKTGIKGDRKEAAEIRKQFLEDLGKILTPEQKEKLKTLMEQARQKATERGKNGVGTTPPPSTGTKTGGGGLYFL